MSPAQRAIILSGVRLYCEGLAHRLASNKQLNIVGIATELDEAHALARELRPGVIIIDASSREFLRIISSLRQLTNAVVVAFAVNDDEGEAIACAEAGVNAFVERDASVDDLVRAVIGCSRGELTLSPRLVAALFRRIGFLARMTSVMPANDLTVREAEIYALVRQGQSNKEIAVTLGISLPTVKNHVHRVLEKLGVHRRAEAAALTRRVFAPETRPAEVHTRTSPSPPVPPRERAEGSGSTTGP